MVNGEVANVLQLVGIDPKNVPARHAHAASRHMDILVRYVGYKAGLDAAKLSRSDYDLNKETPEILGDFIQSRITSKPLDPMDKSVFHEMRRMLALIEGATGYPMTTERMEAKALTHFLKAVILDIEQQLANNAEGNVFTECASMPVALSI